MSLSQQLSSAIGESSGEAELNKKFIDLNKGREGKTIFTITGEELKNSVYLGGTSYAVKDGDQIKIVTPTGMYGKSATAYLLINHFEILKKAF